MVYLVSQGADPDEIGLMNIDEQLPVLEYPQPGLDIIQVMQHVVASASDGGHVRPINEQTDLCVAAGADVTSSNQKPSSSPIPPLGLAQRRG